MNNSYMIFLNALDKIINNGLYEKTSKIYCNLVGEKKEYFIEILSNKFKEEKKIILLKNIDDSGEGCTLNLIHKHSQIQTEYKILYLHSKGATYNKERQKTNPLCTTEFAEQWTNRMLDYLVVNYKSCFQNLKEKETDGIDFNNEPLPHYSGNFWWANSSYIKSLKSYSEFYFSKEEYYDYRKLSENDRTRPMFTIDSNRMLAEYWLCSKLKV